MSADVMEVDTGQFHYTEQLLRVDGQGIWYALGKTFLRNSWRMRGEYVISETFAQGSPALFLTFCRAIGHHPVVDI